ncbi:MAG: hypothetical protein LC796_05210 [Acidobacteria bacterium]|nr:hypothetical protein [Acidobacteriota bacterium]
MEAIVGIFRDWQSAQKAAETLRASGLPPDRVNLLTPGDPEGAALARVSTSDTEQPGMGKAVGGVVGGVAGATAGMGLGAAAASLLIPGIGPVAAVGLAAAALFGVGGAIGGAAAGGALENAMSHGLPRDELHLYEDALRKGHSVVFAFADDDAQAKSVRDRLAVAGAETLDAAREDWWVGLRSGEAADYERSGGHFTEDEPVYRRGFQAALHPEHRGKSFEAARETLATRHADVAGHPAFRRGYERGSSHLHALSQRFDEADTGEMAQRRV